MARTTGKTKKRLTFSILAPEAIEVQLAGAFTQWQEHPIAMRKYPDGTWRAAVDLPPGPHPYRFIVDGEWRDDPGCSFRVANPFGSHDSICHVS